MSLAFNVWCLAPRKPDSIRVARPRCTVRSACSSASQLSDALVLQSWCLADSYPLIRDAPHSLPIRQQPAVNTVTPGLFHANLAVPLLFFLALRPSPLPRACGVRAHRYSIIYLGNLVIHEPTGPVKRDTRRKILQYDGSVEHEVEEIIGVDGKPPRRICGGGRHEADQLEGCWEH